MATATAVANGLDQALGEKTWPWVHSAKLQVSLVVALSVMTFLDTVKRAFHRLRSGAVDRQRVEVRNQLSQLIVTLSEVTRRPISDFGCGLFLAQGRGLLRPERLVRRERVRLVDDLHESPVEFTRGKGVVGDCWARCSITYRNWVATNRRWASKNISPADWVTIPSKHRGDFDLHEFQSLVGKYSEVLAVPITKDNRFLGCIAVDLKWHADHPDQSLVLERANVRAPVSAAARTIVPTLVGG